jgi:hypothetical protein
MRLWFIRQTDKARLYSTTDPSNPHRDGREIWVPLSIIEHTTKRGIEHDVKLPDWFIEKESL